MTRSPSPLAWRPDFPGAPTRGSLTSPSYLVRNRTRGPPLQSLSCIRLFATPWTVARQAPLSMGILQARILGWVAMPSSRGSFQPRDRTPVSSVSCIGRQILYQLRHLGSPTYWCLAIWKNISSYPSCFLSQIWVIYIPSFSIWQKVNNCKMPIQNKGPWKTFIVLVFWINSLV